jgi:hypothetical protein
VQTTASKEIRLRSLQIDVVEVHPQRELVEREARADPEPDGDE